MQEECARRWLGLSMMATIPNPKLVDHLLILEYVADSTSSWLPVAVLGPGLVDDTVVNVDSCVWDVD